VNNWVLPSNPSAYDAAGALTQNGEADWITKNNFEVGDVVYIYEVIPPRGRGGIVYQTKVIKTDISLEDKLEDRKYWSGQVYPNGITEQTRFSRLKLIGEPNGNVIFLKELRQRGFTAPQGRASLLDKKPDLLRYVQTYFD
jgi:hypothetical protein